MNGMIIDVQKTQKFKEMENGIARFTTQLEGKKDKTRSIKSGKKSIIKSKMETKKIIKLNGKEYCLLSEYKKLEKSKIRVKKIKKIVEKEKIIKEEVEKINLRDYMVSDPSNCYGQYPLKRENGEVTELETGIDFFKLIENPRIKQNLDNNFDSEKISIEDSCYSSEFIKEIKQIAKSWGCSQSPRIFMAFDKSDNKFLKDHPIMFLFENKLCFILAPRVEDGN